MIDVTVLFFATLKERAGVRQVGLELAEGMTVIFKRRLAADFSGLGMGTALVRNRNSPS
jgi:molybdopterin converting factor small subunit